MVTEESAPKCLLAVGVLGPSSSTVSIGNFSPLGRDPVDLDIRRELVPGFNVDKADEDASDKRVVDVVNVLKRLFSSSGNEGEVYEELDDSVDILWPCSSLFEPEGNATESLVVVELAVEVGERGRLFKVGDDG